MAPTRGLLTRPGGAIKAVLQTRGAQTGAANPFHVDGSEAR
jgi:hypothetical protein